MRRVVTRISHEIIERNNGAQDLVLLGLVRRGALLASRLSSTISKIEDVRVPVFSLDISTARDDRENEANSNRTIESLEGITQENAPNFPQLFNEQTNLDLSSKKVVLVDDVLFTGRSIRAAMDIVSRISRPNRIQLAVLIDRGHRELPIRADFVGKNLPTKSSEHVNVLMSEIDGQDCVEVERESLS